MSAEPAEAPEPLPYRLVVPGGWTQLPMDPVGMRDAARAMLRRQLAGQGRDETARMRHEAERELVALTRRAGSEYARMLLVMSRAVQGRPIAASCLVSLLPHRLDGEQALQDLAGELGDGALTSVVEDLGAHRGVVVVRDQLLDSPSGVDLEATAREQAAQWVGRPVPEELPAPVGTVRVVECHLPVPDSDRVLLLSFTTAVVPLFDALTELFLLIASTVQWQETVQWQDEPGRWR